MLGAKIMGFWAPIFQPFSWETAQKRLRNGRECPNGTKWVQSSMLGITLSIFTLRIPIFDHDVGGENYGVTYVVFVWATWYLEPKTRPSTSSEGRRGLAKLCNHASKPICQNCILFPEESPNGRYFGAGTGTREIFWKTGNQKNNIVLNLLCNSVVLGSST